MVPPECEWMVTKNRTQAGPFRWAASIAIALIMQQKLPLYVSFCQDCYLHPRLTSDHMG